MGLLDGQIAAIVSRATQSFTLQGTLWRDGATSVNTKGNPVPGTPVTYAFRGFDEAYTDAYRAATGIPSTDLRIWVVAGSISTTPTQDDKIYLRGQWFQARSVATDPARAMFDIQAYRIEDPT